MIGAAPTALSVEGFIYSSIQNIVNLTDEELAAVANKSWISCAAGLDARTVPLSGCWLADLKTM